MGRIRACLCYEVSDRAGKENAKKAVDENIAWIRQSGIEDCLIGMMGLHASFTLSDETLGYAMQQMEGNQAYHIHVAECMEDENECIQKYGIRIIERLNRLGILGKHTLIAHGVYLDEAEQEQIRERDAMVVNNPESNMNNAVDCPPGMELVHKGIITGLGMDGFTHDMVSAWRIGKDVVTVMCNGNILMQDRELIGIDEEKLYAEARIEAFKLWNVL